MQELNKEDNFSKIMLKSKLHITSEDLEDSIMQRILQQQLYKRRVYKNVKISVAFLILTVILGFTLSNSFSEINFNSISIFPKGISWIFQIMLVSAFLFLTDNLIKIFKERNKFFTS